MHKSEITFLQSLFEATEKKLVTWKAIEDDDRDRFQGMVDGEKIEIELVYFEVATGGVFERLIAIVSGLDVYIRVSVGTLGYDLVAKILSNSIDGWNQGRVGAIENLSKATGRVQKLLVEE